MSARQIGPGVIRAVEWLERNGPACIEAGRPQKGEVREVTGRSLRRAVEYGLATRVGTGPYVYRPVPGWRDVLRESPGPLRFEGMERPVSCVWDMAVCVSQRGVTV